MVNSTSRVGKIREDAYFNELDQTLLAELREMMELAGEVCNPSESECADTERSNTTLQRETEAASR